MGLSDIFKKEKEKNINLIPKEEAGGGFSVKDYIIPILIPILAIVLLVIAFVGLFTLEQAESIKARNLEEDILDQTTQWQKFSDKATTLKKINNALGIYQEGSVQNKFFEDSTKKVRSAVPNGVKLTSLDIKEAGKVAISGISQNPKTIFQLFNRLRDTKQNFSDVKLLSIGYQSSEEGSGGQSKEEGFIFTMEFEMNDEKEST